MTDRFAGLGAHLELKKRRFETEIATLEGLCDNIPQLALELLGERKGPLDMTMTELETLIMALQPHPNDQKTAERKRRIRAGDYL